MLIPIRYKRASSLAASDTKTGSIEPILLAANDSFLVSLEALTVRGRTIEVFCFEEDINMPDGQSTGLWI